MTLVYSSLQQEGHKIQLIRKPAPEPRGPERPEVDEFGYDPDYSYQPETVDALIKHRQIVAQCATGSGKSRIATIAIARIQRPTLFLTTRQVLMHQMRRAWEKSIAYRIKHGEKHLVGTKVGVMGDDEFSPRKMLNVGMVQTINARLNDRDPAVRERMREILAMFELVILEEAHEASGNGYFSIMNLCTNAAYRLALTATPFMKSDEEANIRLMAVSGPIAIRVSELDLIERGILARPYFKFLDAPHSSLVRRGSGYPRAVQYGIVENEWRNRLICKEAKRFTELGLTTMILIQRKEHGKLLNEQLLTAGIRSRFIFGETTQAQRELALAQLERHEIDTLIGSTILDVGVDVPAVGALINGGGGKAEVALRQRIGRCLRKKPKGQPNVAYIVDFHDGCNKHLETHSLTRKQIIEGTPGFQEGVLAAGQDFDFSVFTRAKAA